MINISGHYREERKITGYCDNDVPLMVNCCGKQIFQTQDYFCNRKDGRLDYQIIYIHRGSGHFYINNEWTTLSAGNIVLYRPGIPQFYSYYANEKPEVYWIHFTGNQCEDILNTYDVKTCYIGERLYLKLLFQEIITELQLKKVSYQDIVLHNFYIILCSIHRSFSSLSKPFDNDFSFDRLLPAAYHQKIRTYETIQDTKIPTIRRLRRSSMESENSFPGFCKYRYTAHASNTIRTG